MPRFIYTVRDNKGSKQTGAMHAEDESNLEEKLADSGYFLISLKKDKAYEARKNVKLKEKQKINFTRNLASLLQGGLTLAESIKGLIYDAKDPQIIAILTDISHHVEAGGTLAGALRHHPRTFSEFYIATIASGESTGALGKTIEQLSNHLEWKQDLRKKIIELSIYPAIIIILMSVLISGLFIFILPKFQAIFSELGSELPIATQMAMQASGIFSSYWYLIFGFLFLVIAGTIFALKNPKIRFIYDKYKLRLPIFGKLIYDVNMSKFVRSMELCLKNGITILTTLELAENSLGNIYLKNSVQKIKESVGVKGDLTTAFSLVGTFPNNLVRMIHVGESGGSLFAAFEKARAYYDKEIPHRMQAIFAILEPLLIILMGVIIGSLALVVILPLVQMMNVV
ncbi:MAG: type II secretion system F family protein [Candidatus Omnitrophica bacterium]|nr:type II secretion system F family protein [Candidatus Omnitrophota bacterium]MCF7894124.1 type II secretion system F family protein [Candidatus Omnitrophota bacterium]